MNLPNKLTISRIILTFIFMILLFSKGLAFKVSALVVFFIASCTDFIDGYLAKKTGEVTDFGRLMDPIADKVLVISAFLAFVEMKLVPAWIVVIIVLREFIITGLRLMAFRKGEVIEAELAGKHKLFRRWFLYMLYLFLLCLEKPAIGCFLSGQKALSII